MESNSQSQLSTQKQPITATDPKHRRARERLVVKLREGFILVVGVEGGF